MEETEAKGPCGDPRGRWSNKVSDIQDTKGHHHAAHDRQLRQLHLQPGPVLLRGWVKKSSRAQRRNHLDGIAALKAGSSGFLAGPLLAGRRAGICVRRLSSASKASCLSSVCAWGTRSIGAALGGKIVRAREQMHGKPASSPPTRRASTKVCPAVHGDPLPLAGHRRATLPECLKSPSFTDDGEIAGRASQRPRKLTRTRHWKACSSTPSPS